jgi:hypothetical protein
MKFKVEILWYWKLDLSQNRPETHGKLWNVVLEKDVDQFDQSYETWGNFTWSQGGEEYSTDL